MPRVTQLLEKLGLVTMDGAAVIDPQPASDTDFSSSPDEFLPKKPLPAADLSPAEPDNADLTIDVSRIYEKAGIKSPAHGFTVLKLIDMMNAEEFRGMDAVTLKKIFTGLLRGLPGGPVPFEDIIRDARDRDKALDEYDSAYTRMIEAEAVSLREENVKLMAELEETRTKTQAQIDANEKKIAESKTQINSWRRKKESEESRLYKALEPFVSRENPITMGRSA